MSNTYLYLFAPAATMTKLEAVTVELFARQASVKPISSIGSKDKSLAIWAIESALVLLTLLDDYQSEHEPESYTVHKTRARIVQLVQEKKLEGDPLEKILCDRYGIDQLCDLGPDGEVDLASYLDTL